MFHKIHMHHTKNTTCDLFNVCKNHTTFKLWWDKNLKKQFAVHDSDTPVTKKQGLGHQAWYELVDLKQGYNDAKFEKPCLNRQVSVQKPTILFLSNR